jgi:hypothetical protein
VHVRVRPAAAFFVFLAGAAALAACNGGSSSSTPGNCGAPTGKVALVYPAPGSTGIADNFPGVIFGSTNGLGSNYQALLLPAGSSQTLVLAPVAPAPTPLPTPNQVPSFANPVYQESSAAGVGITLAADTVYQVYLNDGGSNCSPSYQGSFTSQ